MEVLDTLKQKFKRNRKKMLKKFFHRLWNFLSYKITTSSLLPATIFTKKQIAQINSSFEIFWGLRKGSLSFSSLLNFSTVTLGPPKNFWTYFFQSLEEITLLRAAYTPLPFIIKTSSHTHLCGCHFKKTKTTKEKSRALLIFGGNGELYRMGSSGWLFKLLYNAPQDVDIIMFDPRECGNSEGKAFAGALVEDGICMFSYVEKQLGFSQDLIDVYGFSLGGAIATLVKYHFKNSRGCLINNRSFQSLDKAIQEIFSPLGLNLKYFLGRHAKKLARYHAWHLSPLQAFRELSCPKLLICSHQDPIVRYRASLEKGLKDQNALYPHEHLLLIPKKQHRFIFNHHVQPLSFYDDSCGKDAQARVLDFLMETRAY
jgi:pimeloyl-ACP methyl ester carboxylesterase